LLINNKREKCCSTYS